METRKEKIIALVGDLLNDSATVKTLSLQLTQLGVKWQYYKDIVDDVSLTSVVLILNDKNEYRADANTFIHNILAKRIPIIVIYTEVGESKEIHDSTYFSEYVSKLWEQIPAFAEERFVVPTVHIPLCDLERIIKSNDFVKGTKLDPSDYYLQKKDDK